MEIINNELLKTFNLPGLVHKTLSDNKNGNNSFEVWMQTVEPNAATPIHKHNCNEVIIILKGSGTLITENKEVKFTANSTLFISPDEVHQLINTGDEPIDLLGCLGMSPVEVYSPDNILIPLPWQS